MATSTATPHFPPGFTRGVGLALEQYLNSPSNQSGKAILLNFLNQYGLGGLADWAWSRYLELGGGNDAMQVIQFELPQQKAFQARFPAYQKLAKEGHVMSAADMLSLENSYRQVLHAAGLPQGFYDQPADFAKFMLDGVSPSELSQRAQLAAQFVSGDPEALALGKEFGIPTGHQIAYIIDPGRALPLITNQINAAQDAAAAQETGFRGLRRDQAMQLAQLGVTSDAARTQFADLAKQAGLFAGTTAEGSNITEQEQFGAAFLGNANAALRIANRQAERRAAFQGAGGFNAGNAGVSGLGTQQ